MKETMIKRFFSPIWKCEEIELTLEQLENDGWRLEKISGFGKFKFVKSKPKTTKYFFTCSFAKESGMILTEHALKDQCKAIKIRGNFIEMLKITSIYRITRAEDLLERKINRNIYLRHLVIQYILLGYFFALIGIAGVTLSCVLNKNPLLDIRHSFLVIVGLFGLIIIIRYLFGLLYLRRRYIKYFQQTSASSE